MPLAAYRGPLVIIGVGVGFAAVGSVPVAVTFSLGTRSSATIIGMGFIGFGFLLMLPGVFWCLMVRTHSFKVLRRRLCRGRSTEGQGAEDDEEQTPALHKSSDELTSPAAAAVPRSKCWPPSYSAPPPLIVTDYGVCRASTPTADAPEEDPERSDASTAQDCGDAAEPPSERTSHVVVTVSDENDDNNDSQRLLSPSEHQIDTASNVSTTDATVQLSRS